MRSHDAERLNDLVNHPTIRPTAGGDGESYIDLGPALEDRDNIFLDGEHGGLFFHWSAPNTYEVHIFVLPEGRGAWAYGFAKAGLAYMIAHDAIHLWCRLLDRNTMLFTRHAGFVPRGRKDFDIGGGPKEYELFDWRRECPQQLS